MRRLLLVLVLALLGLPAHADGPPAGDGGWFWQNPLPTSNLMSGIHFVSPTTGWIIGQAGLIMRTDDGGATWTTQRSGTDADFSSGFFLDENHAWVIGTRVPQNVMLATRDGGATWIPQYPGTDETLESVFFLDAMNGIAVGAAGTIRRTRNDGLSWSTVNTGVGAQLYDVYFTDETHGWIVGGDGYSRVLLRSSDGGSIWTGALTIPGTTLARVQFLDANKGWAAAGGGALLGTEDGGDTWTPTSAPLGTNFQFVNASTGWRISPRLSRTSDGGATWKDLPWYVQPTRLGMQFLDPLRGFSIRYDDLMPYQTGDGGATWQPILPAQDRTSFTGISFPTAREGWALISDGTAWHTTDAGKTWQTVHTGFSRQGAVAIDFPDTQHGWIAGYGGTLFHTEDGGTTWKPQDIGSTAYLRAIQAIDADHAFILADTAAFRTRDGGGTWEALPGTPKFHMVSADVGFRVRGNIVQRTDDGALHWADVAPLDERYRINLVHFLDAENGLLAGDFQPDAFQPARPALLRTRDGGRTWEDQPFGPERMDAIRLLGPEEEWALAHGYAYHSLDGGRTWLRHFVAPYWRISDVSFPDARNGWMAGADGTILHTRTGGLLPGDVNGDGQINKVDAARALAVAGGLNGDIAQAARADYDGDGNATLADVTEILRNPSLPRLSLEGTVLGNANRRYTTIGSHALRGPYGTLTALVSASVNLRTYEGKTVRLSGVWYPGYVPDGMAGVQLVNVTWIAAK